MPKARNRARHLARGAADGGGAARKCLWSSLLIIRMSRIFGAVNGKTLVLEDSRGFRRATTLASSPSELMKRHGPVSRTRSRESSGRVAPERQMARRMSISSNPGRARIFVQALPAAEENRTLDRRGRAGPVWSRNGGALYLVPRGPSWRLPFVAGWRRTEELEHRSNSFPIRSRARKARPTRPSMCSPTAASLSSNRRNRRDAADNPRGRQLV